LKVELICSNLYTLLVAGLEPDKHGVVVGFPDCPTVTPYVCIIFLILPNWLRIYAQRIMEICQLKQIAVMPTPLRYANQLGVCEGKYFMGIAPFIPVAEWKL